MSAPNASYQASLMERLRRHARGLRLLRLAAHHAPEAIFLVARDARIVDVNRTACRRLEYTRRELLRLRIYDIDPEYPQHLWDERWEGSRRLKLYVVETRHRTKSGRLIPVEIAVQFLVFEGEEYCASVVRDITERRHVQQVMREQQAAILELSAPILSVSDGVLAVPVMGALDAARAARITERLLQGIAREGARCCILDLTGVDAVDSATAGHIETISRAVRLLGSRCLLSGIAPHVARTIVELGLDLGSVVTFGELRGALRYALTTANAI